MGYKEPSGGRYDWVNLRKRKELASSVGKPFFFFLREEKGFSMVNLFGEEVSLLGDHLAGFHSLVWEDFLLEEDG